MKVGDYQIEVETYPHADSFVSIAFLPGGKRIASAPWDTREAAERDVYNQALMILMPAPKFDPSRTYEGIITQRRADNLLEHCGHCPEDQAKCEHRWIEVQSHGHHYQPGEKVLWRCHRCQLERWFTTRDKGHTWQPVPPVSESRPFGRCECSDPGCPACGGRCAKRAKTNLIRVDMADEKGTLFCDTCASDALDSGLFREDRGAYIRATTLNPRQKLRRSDRYLPPSKASFYPSDGGGVTSA
jgi:hypothetical protein